MTRSLLTPILLFVALGLAPRAHAGEEDASALLRRARTAETVDRDAAAALDLYRGALEAPGDPDASRDAALSLARLQEERGAASEALAALALATERFASRMDEATKRQVHEAMVRLLPPGATARSPLGQVFVVGAVSGAAAASPLDQKIRDILARYETVEANQQWSVRQQISQSLAAVGRDAWPVLERILFADRPDRATLAAGLYAELAGVDALPGLERAAREGDGFTRDAALRALGQIPHGDMQNAKVVEAADRLRQEPRLSPHERLLLDVLLRRLPPKDLLARHRAGGPDATAFLRAALAQKAEGALDRALTLAKAGGEEGRKALEVLLPLVFPPDGGSRVYPPETLDAASRRAFLDLLLGGPSADQSLSAIASLLGGLAADGGWERLAPDVERTWRLIQGIPDLRTRRSRTEHLVRQQVPIPPSLLRDRAWAHAFLDLGPSSWVAAWFEALFARPEFWEAFLDVAPSLDGNVLGGWLGAFQGGFPQARTEPPAAFDARWIPLVAKNRAVAGYPFVLKAAARSGDPSFLEAVRAQAAAGWPQELSTYLVVLHQDYRGPGLMEFAQDLLRNPTLPPHLLRPVFALLAERTGPAGQEAILAIARDWKHPQAVYALGQIGPAATDADLLEIARQVQAATPPPEAPYRSALIGLFQTRKMREAVPYLVWEYRKGERSEHAGKALDAIRDYHEKIAAFEAWAKGGPAPSATADLLALLGNADPEVRRAAAIALGALRRKDALEALVKAGAEDGDERVRKAALAAVEQIGRN